MNQPNQRNRRGSETSGIRHFQTATAATLPLFFAANWCQTPRQRRHPRYNPTFPYRPGSAIMTLFGITDFGLFCMAVLLLNATPGPDTAYIVGRSVAQGPAAGLVSALGISAG